MYVYQYKKRIVKRNKQKKKKKGKNRKLFNCMIFLPTILPNHTFPTAAHRRLSGQLNENTSLK